MTKLLAIGSQNLGNFEGIGTVGLEGGTGEPVAGFASLISTFIGLVTIVGAFYFLFALITGAIGIMTSEGEKAAYEQARKKLTVGAIGMAILVAGVFITDFIAWLIGIDGLFNFAEMINRIAPI